jgi:hypothetical protein
VQEPGGVQESGGVKNAIIAMSAASMGAARITDGNPAECCDAKSGRDWVGGRQRQQEPRHFHFIEEAAFDPPISALRVRAVAVC